MVAQIDLKYFKTRPSKLVSRLISYVLFEGRPVTTSGQWINPFLFAHFTLGKWMSQLKKVEQPVYILGTGRSGTTILGVVLSMHREVGFLNEPKAMWHAIFSKEDVIGSYSRGPARYRLQSCDVDGAIKSHAHKLFGAYLASIFSKRLVDKYPELVFRVPFVREIFPDAKFIFLVRNGWETCSSIDKWSARCGKQKNGEVHDWWGVNQRKWKLMLKELIEPDEYFSSVVPHLGELEKHTDMAALEWVVTMREGMRRMRENSEDCIKMVRYEDLVANPRSVMRGIAKFAEFSEDETWLRYGEAVLRPAPPHSEFEMHPAVCQLFTETMQELGY